MDFKGQLTGCAAICHRPGSMLLGIGQIGLADGDAAIVFPDPHHIAALSSRLSPEQSHRYTAHEAGGTEAFYPCCFTYPVRSAQCFARPLRSGCSQLYRIPLGHLPFLSNLSYCLPKYSSMPSSVLFRRLTSHRRTCLRCGQMPSPTEPPGTPSNRMLRNVTSAGKTR